MEVHSIPHPLLCGHGVIISSIWRESIHKWVAEAQENEPFMSLNSEERNNLVENEDKMGTSEDDGHSGTGYGIYNFVARVGYAIMASGRLFG